MRRFFLFWVTVALVGAVPQYESHMESKMNRMQECPDEMIQKANRALNAFEEYIPAVMKKELTEMTANRDEVKAYCEFELTTRFHNVPSTIGPELWNYFKQNLPLTAPRIERIEKSFEESFNKISKPGQDYLSEFYGKLNNFKTGNGADTTANLIKILIDGIEKYNDLPGSVKMELNNQYPEIIRFVNTKEFGNFYVKLQALKGKSDFEIAYGLKEPMAELAPIYNKLNY